MGQGARIVLVNVSKHNVVIATADEDWIKEKNDLGGAMRPGEARNNGYFEYADLHTGHVTISGSAEGKNSRVQLGLEELEIMADRTITESDLLLLTIAKSVYLDQSTFVMAFHDR